MLPMLRPWGFAPRNATSIETAQLNEEYSATQQPLYSTLPDADDVTAVNGCANIRMAVRPNQRIIMLMIAFQVVQVMLLALNPLFDSYLPKLENFSKAVPVTVLATGV